VIKKELKTATFAYKEQEKTLWINTLKDPNGIELPRHYMFSLARFIIRIAQKGKSRKGGK
jgi:hypothetical protein